MLWGRHVPKGEGLPEAEAGLPEVEAEVVRPRCLVVVAQLKKEKNLKQY